MTDTNLNATLRRLRGTPVARKFATIDIESSDWVNPYAVGFYDGEKHYDFIGYDNCIEDALQFVFQPKYAGWWIYAHNGGNYDFLFFLKTIIQSPKFLRQYFVEITPIGSSLIRIGVFQRDPSEHKPNCKDHAACPGCLKKRSKNKQLKWTFVDSVRLMPRKLDELGETFGIGRKVKLEMSYNDLAKPKNRAVMRKYLEVDCKLLHQSISKMQSTINGLGGQLGVTLPSTSLDLFRRKFQAEDIATNRHFRSCPEYDGSPPADPKNRCPGCMHEFIRKAYYGGRTEIYRMVFKPHKDIKLARLYDINSHYPCAMLEPMPVSQAFETEGLNEAAVYANAKKLIGIVDCDVEIPADCYLPPLPVQHEGKLIFPTGRLRGTWDTAELCLLARVGGQILCTRKSLWFDSSPVFTRFVKTIYKFRDKTRSEWTKGMDFIAKIILNALYGKFAMKENRSRVLISPDSPQGLTCIDLDADIWSESILVSPQYIVPQLSAHVTAIARARLWEILASVVDKGGRVYYCDTDSVVCSGVDLPTGKGLGDLKLEATITRAEFVLPKLYLIETTAENEDKQLEKHTKIKAKGMGPGIRLDEGGDDPYDGQLSNIEFINLVRNGMPLNRHRLTKFKESLRDYAKKSLSFPRVIPAVKRIKSQYTKRVVEQDYNTSPLSLKHF